MEQDNLTGITIGPYEILEKIGQGGMAEVYKGRHVALQRLVAIKFLGRSLEIDARLTQRFQREAQAIAAMRHPNIVQVHDFGTFKGGHYLVMEYVEGTDLRREIDQRQAQPPFSPEEVLDITKQIAFALDYAHEQGIIHRDVKPGNILLTKHGQAILGDFGLVMLRDRISQATLGNTFGTPEYIAPEQAMDSRAAVPQSDIYALGGIAYEMVTGRLPFEADSALSLALKHISEDPVPPRTLNPALPQAVEDVILRALDKDPEKRYATAQEFVDALHQAWETGTAPILNVASVTDSIPPPPSKQGPSTPSPSHPTPPAGMPSAKAVISAESQPPAPEPAAPSRKRRRWPLIALLGVLLIGGGIVVTQLTGGAVPLLRNPTTTPTATYTRAPTTVPQTNTPTLSPTPSTVPTYTPPPTDMPTPTATPSPTPTPVPTDTPTPAPTDTPTATATPTLAPGETRTREVDGMAMHFVPAGSFLMGTDDEGQVNSDEQPQHEVTLSAYWIDETEVTTDQYKQCVAAGVCEAPFTRTAYDDPAYANRPMTYISWEDAAAYCQWIGSTTGGHVRLPTEAQWEKAASWDPESQSKLRYPWGNEYDESKLPLGGAPRAVGSYPENASPYGALDMAGNVWEWVADWYDKDYYQNEDLPADPTGPQDGQYRVMRGGGYDSWGDKKRELRTTHREVGAPKSTSDRPAKGPNLGFRCVVNAEWLPEN